MCACVGAGLFLLLPPFSVCVCVAMSGRRMSRPLAQLMLERMDRLEWFLWTTLNTLPPGLSVPPGLSDDQDVKIPVSLDETSLAACAPSPLPSPTAAIDPHHPRYPLSAGLLS